MDHIVSEKMICTRCGWARFPHPGEQCYKTGGLICTFDDANVGKYDPCRLGKPPERERE